MVQQSIVGDVVFFSSFLCAAPCRFSEIGDYKVIAGRIWNCRLKVQDSSAAAGRGSEGRHERSFRFLMELVTQL